MKNSLYIIAILLASCAQEKGTDLPAELAKDTGTTNSMSFTEEQMRRQGLETVSLTEFNFGDMIRSNGYIDVPPEGRASVSAFYGGYVKSVELIPGQSIKKGEVLLTLENPEYLEMQQQYLSTLRQMDYLSDDYERQKTLLDENISSRKSFLKAESEYNTAVANLEGLRQKLLMLGISLSNVENGRFTSVISLKSPLTGYITNVQAVQGQFLPPAQPAVDIINPDHLHLEIQVFEKDLPKISIGQKVRMRLPSAESIAWFDATVYLVGKDISGDNRVARVHAHMKNEADEKKLTPGMYIETDILLSDDLQPAIHGSAVQSNGADRYIWIAENSSWPMKFRKLDVDTGREISGYVELLTALPDNAIILSGEI